MSAAPVCRDCGRPISAHAARYRGAERCRACANRAKAGTFTPETAAAGVAARAAKRAETERLARLARAAGLGQNSHRGDMYDAVLRQACRDRGCLTEEE